MILSNNSAKFEERIMNIALNAAKEAFAIGEIPIGAVICDKNGEIIAIEHNRTISSSDPTAHAEILAIRKAAKKLQNHRLIGCQLFVSVEPCIMCIGAILQARIENLFFAAHNSKGGSCESCFDFCRNAKLNHRLKNLKSGILAEESAELMRKFFALRRKL